MELITKELMIKDADIDESKLCVVCQNAPKVVALVPCGHVCMCEVCETQLAERCCPICNKSYSQTMKVIM